MKIKFKADDIRFARGKGERIFVKFTGVDGTVTIELTKFRLNTWIATYLRDRLGWWLEHIRKMEEE